MTVSFGGNNESCTGAGALGTYSFIQNTGVFTISAWLKLRNPANNAVYGVAVNNNFASSQRGFCWCYENRSSQAAMRMYMSNGSGSSMVDCLGQAGAISDDSWNHVVIRGTGSAARHFINGAGSGSSCNFGPLSMGNSSQLLDFGRADNSNMFGLMDGEIDDFRIYDIALTTSEINSLYLSSRGRATKRLAGWMEDTSHLIGRWALRDAAFGVSLNGQVIRDDVARNNATGFGTQLFCTNPAVAVDAT